MILEYGDWRFDVDTQATWDYTTQNAAEHCLCAYCRNFYDTVDTACPGLRLALKEFGVNLAGPSELLPFEPTLILACYRVQGQILSWGHAPLRAAGVPVQPETGEEGTFLLWVGEMELPWSQEEKAEDVISPANLPEFLERMRSIWQLRHGEAGIVS